MPKFNKIKGEIKVCWIFIHIFDELNKEDCFKKL